MMQNNNTNRTRGILFASITAFLWGFLPVVLKVTVADIDAFTISWFRFVIAFILLFTFFRIKDKSQLRIIGRPPWLLVLAAIGLGFNYVAYLIGVDLTSPANAQIIIQLAPVILALTGMFVIKEKVSTRQGFGFAIALLGFVAFYRDQLNAHSGHEEVYNWGTFMVVLAALSWVAYGLIQKNLVKKHPPQQLNLVIFGVPAVLLIPLVNFGSLLEATTTNWILLLYMGLNTIVAYGCLTEAFKHLEISKVGIIIAINPIITLAIMGVLEYQEVSWISPEKITIVGAMGAGLILLGAILAVKSSSGKRIGLSRRFRFKKSLA